MPWMIPAALAATSLVNGGIQANQAAAERKRQAAMTRYSPWTGQAGHTVQDPNVFGGAVKGGIGGLALAQNMAKNQQQNDLADTFKKFMQSKTSPVNSTGVSPTPNYSPDTAGSGTSMSQGLQNASQDPNANFSLTGSPASGSQFSLMAPSGSAGALQGAGMGVVDPAITGGLGMGADALMSAPAAGGSLWDMLGTGMAAA